MALITWPPVFNEWETLEQLHYGYSISRYGDGEFALADGAGQVREPANPVLAAALRQVLLDPHPKTLLAIPTMDSHGPKYVNWLARQPRMLKFLQPGHTYYSSFLSRPDSAPSIRSRAYAERMVALWSGGKRIALVSEPKTAIHRLMQRTLNNGTLIHISCPHTRTFALIDRLEKDLVQSHPDIAILSCGPAATVLADRVTRHCIQTLDLGSAGSLLLHELFSGTNTLRVFALGFPKTGTVSLQYALEAAGLRVAHQHPRWLHPTDHTGILLLRAYVEKRDPMADLPGCEAIVHPSVCTGPPQDVNVWPQFHTKLLRSLRHYHPDCVFVLNTRPVEHWIASVTAWKDLRQRLTDADIPGLRPGRGVKDEELRRWVEGHWLTMRKLFADDLNHFVEIDIENTGQCEARLTAALGQRIVWPHLNEGKAPHG
mgnify:CR=1 FL=1